MRIGQGLAFESGRSGALRTRAAAMTLLLGVLAGCGTAGAGSASVSADATAPSSRSTGASAPATETAPPAPAAAAPSAGNPDGPGADALSVRVVGITDGDTIKVEVDGVTERVRLIGLDAPEVSGAQCYGQEATSRMQSLAQSRTVWIESDPTQDDRDRYQRLLRHVYTADGTSVAGTLISEGYAREYTYDAAYRHQPTYRAAEADATRQGLGLWGACAGGTGTTAGPAGGATQSTPTTVAGSSTGSDTAAGGEGAACSIKGNIASDGEQIYHVPGQEHYEETKISVGKGERWFCSEDEAVQAGWRKAKR